MPGAYNKKELRKYKQQITAGFEVVSGTLDGTTTEEVIELSGVASKITLQSTGDLAYTYTVSVNGSNFATGGTVAANVLSSYNTHNVSSVKITRTGGSGTVIIAAVA